MNKKIILTNVSKCYKMYNSPSDRLKEAFSISKKSRHTDFYALSNINLDVQKGEILGIMGRNGAGKSTLLKIITGILEPSNGAVYVDGKISSLLELGMGFNMEYTGVENIYFYGTLMGIDKKAMDEKIMSIISFAEIGDYVYQPVKTYSSGMFARLAFSCAINVEPDILIVDEILSVGDMRFQAKCFNKFKEFKEKGVTILYVGHDVGMMRTFCDSAVWLNNGEIVAKGDPTYICAQYTEFMYADDISEFTKYKKYSGNQLDDKFDLNNSYIKCDPIIAENSRFQDSLAHWGSNVGLIKKVELSGSGSKKIGYFMSQDSLKLSILFQDNKILNYDYLSVAFSIKNKEGTDILVYTTYDNGIFLKKKDSHLINFIFQPRLSQGEYYLVVALENRENASITYYEYIEGAEYFKIYSDKKIFGIIDVDVDVDCQ